MLVLPGAVDRNPSTAPGRTSIVSNEQHGRHDAWTTDCRRHVCSIDACTAEAAEDSESPPDQGTMTRFFRGNRKGMEIWGNADLGAAADGGHPDQHRQHPISVDITPETNLVIAVAASSAATAMTRLVSGVRLLLTADDDGPARRHPQPQPQRQGSSQVRGVCCWLLTMLVRMPAVVSCRRAARGRSRGAEEPARWTISRICANAGPRHARRGSGESG